MMTVLTETASDVQGLIDTTVAGYVPTSRTVAGHALSSNVTVSASDVGLGSVDNTADTAKPVSTAQQTALDLKANLASPSLTTPTLGAATATTINKVTITQPAVSATLTIATTKTLTVNGDTTLTNGTHSGTNTGDQTLVGLGGVATTRSLTINGTAQDLSADRTWTVTASFGGIPNLYTADFTIAANTGWPVVGYITLQGNIYCTIPSTSRLFMMN